MPIGNWPTRCSDSEQLDGDGDTVFHVGIEWVGVLACMLITARTRNLLLGLVVGVAIVAIARALGLAAMP